VTVFGGVILPTDHFRWLEMRHSDTVWRLLPEQRREEFREFHAFELWNQQGVFHDLDPAECRKALASLLTILREHDAVFFYSALDRERYLKSAVGGGELVDVLFRMCLSSLDQWARRPAERMLEAGGQSLHTLDRWLNNMCLVIVDEDTNRGPKEVLRKSFRQFRSRLHNSWEGDQARHSFLHDAMFFGDSTESVALQIADACCYVMRRHLEGLETYNLFNLLGPSAFVSKAEPDWSRFKDVFVCHVDAKSIESISPWGEAPRMLSGGPQ
jgi:hypothetical protein